MAVGMYRILAFVVLVGVLSVRIAFDAVGYRVSGSWTCLSASELRFAVCCLPSRHVSSAYTARSVAVKCPVYYTTARDRMSYVYLVRGIGFLEPIHIPTVCLSRRYAPD